MPELIILIVIFLLLMLAVVWGHFIRKHRHTAIVNNTNREDTNVSLYHEHKLEIENDFNKGRIDDENYQYLITELDQSLLQDIEENKKASTNDIVENKPISIIWPILLTLFILVFSFWMYNFNGAYKQLSQPLPQANQGESSDQAQQIIAHIKSIIDLTVKEPNNSDAWYSLGQAFVNIGEFNRASEAFDKVIEIEGESAELFGAKAQALYYRDKQTMSGDVQQLIDQALTLDPADASTNILLGMHSFTNQNYSLAIKYWETVINSNKTNVQIEALQQAVDEAKNRLQQAGNNQPAEETASSPQLTVNVDVSEKIKDLLIQGEDKVVFIYAVSADEQHGRMPVAAVKLKANDLPVTIVLNDSKAMSPQAKLSDVPAVNIYAVISSSGGVGVKSGDFKTELLNADVLSTEPVSLLIDTIVP